MGIWTQSKRETLVKRRERAKIALAAGAAAGAYPQSWANEGLRAVALISRCSAYNASDPTAQAGAVVNAVITAYPPETCLVVS